MAVDVSIIIPCFNGAKYLSKLCESLRPLVAGNVEIVFVDDGSTDESSELFRQLLPQATCVRQENRGLGATRNRAVEMARGEYLQLLDADDTIQRGKLEAQLAFARRQGLDILYSDWRMVIVEGETETYEDWVNAETEVEIVEALLGGWWFPPNAALVRRQSYLSVGGCDSSLGNTCEDFDLWVRLGIAGFRFGYLPGAYANYYRYMNVRSMSRKDPSEFFEGEAGIIMKAVSLLTARQAATPARRRAAARRLQLVARNLFGINRSRFSALMAEVSRLDPQFRPVGTLTYRVAARLFGFEVAERLAAWKRHGKSYRT